MDRHSWPKHYAINVISMDSLSGRKFFNFNIFYFSIKKKQEINIELPSSRTICDTQLTKLKRTINYCQVQKFFLNYFIRHIPLSEKRKLIAILLFLFCVNKSVKFVFYVRMSFVVVYIIDLLFILLVEVIPCFKSLFV